MSEWKIASFLGQHCRLSASGGRGAGRKLLGAPWQRMWWDVPGQTLAASVTSCPVGARDPQPSHPIGLLGGVGTGALLASREESAASLLPPQSPRRRQRATRSRRTTSAPRAPRWSARPRTAATPWCTCAGTATPASPWWTSAWPWR